jgi:predicted Zn-dependent peptidase
MTIQISTLDNGLRVATDTMDGAESVALGVWVGVGTRHEPWNANGVAHLVEHMMFKGTKKRSAFEISKAIEQNGGMMNAHTSREETAYYARVLPEDAELAADIISDMLMHSAFAPKELAREKQVVIQEIGRSYDTPDDHVFDLLYETAFPKQKIGRAILGSAKVIANLPRNAVVDYVHSHYHTGNMVLVGVGKIGHDEMVKLAKRYFSKLPHGKRTKAEDIAIKSGESREARKIEQLHLTMAFAGPGRKSSSYYAASLLGIIMGGSMSSRLFQKVREQKGLVYTVSASHMPFMDKGLFGIYAGTDPSRVKELIPIVCAEMRDVTKNIKPKELRLAKAQVRADFLMGRESVMRRAEVLGHQMVAFGKPISLDSILKKVLAVSVYDVQNMAGKIVSRPPILAGLGPLDNVEAYAKIAERLRG